MIKQKKIWYSLPSKKVYFSLTIILRWGPRARLRCTPPAPLRRRLVGFPPAGILCTSFVGTWVFFRQYGYQHQTVIIQNRPLIILFSSGSDLWSYYCALERGLWSYHSHPEVTPDHTIPIRKRPLIIQFPSGSDLWSYHSHPEVTSDHTIPIRKRPLIIQFPSGSDLWSYHSHPEVTSDHTIPIRKRPLIIQFPSGSDFWSYHSHPEVTSDHTIPIRKWPLIIPSPSGSDLWSYNSHPEVTSDHTIPIRKWPLIIPFSSGSDLWSYHSHPEVTSDHTIPIRKWPLIIPFPSAIDPWSDYSHPEPKPRPCNYGLGTHRVRWTSDDQRSLPDGTSTWVIIFRPISEYSTLDSSNKSTANFWRTTSECCLQLSSHWVAQISSNNSNYFFFGSQIISKCLGLFDKTKIQIKLVNW